MLSSLRASLPEGLAYEVILVDDASTDGTRDWLAQLESPQVRSVVNPQNLGYAASNNRGVELAQGEILGLLNNDLLFSPGWLEPMLQVLNDPARNAGLVGNVQYRVADGALDHAGVQLNLRGQFEHVRQLPAMGSAATVPWITGACVLIRRDLFLSVGGFDTRYRNGCEDLDLCFKVRKAGKSVWMAYASQIRHHVSLSRGSTSEQNERNSQQLFERWHDDIKRALAETWASALKQPLQPGLELDGALAPDLLKTPHAAGLLLAQQQLAIQQRRWQRLLFPGGNGAENMPAPQVSIRHPLPVPLGNRLQFRLELRHCKVLEMLHVCGSVSRQLPAGDLCLTMDLNSLHSKSFQLKPGQSFNLPFERPLLLPLGVNVLNVTVDCHGMPDLEALRCGFTLSHVVLDDALFDASFTEI